MPNPFARAPADVRSTHQQRVYLVKLLQRHEYIARGRVDVRTGPLWRPLFKAVKNEPAPGTNGMTDFPTIDEFIDSLTVTQASDLINHLLED